MLKKGTIAVCEQCGFEWIPKVDSPERCPSRKCRSRAWNLGNGGRGEPAGWEQKKADRDQNCGHGFKTTPLGKERPPGSSGEKSWIDREDVKKKLMERIPVKPASEISRLPKELRYTYENGVACEHRMASLCDSCRTIYDKWLKSKKDPREAK